MIPSSLKTSGSWMLPSTRSTVGNHVCPLLRSAAHSRALSCCVAVRWKSRQRLPVLLCLCAFLLRPRSFYLSPSLSLSIYFLALLLSTYFSVSLSLCLTYTAKQASYRLVTSVEDTGLKTRLHAQRVRIMPKSLVSTCTLLAVAAASS